MTTDPLTFQSSGMTFDALAAGPRDGRPVLLLHGFPQSGRLWRPVMARLAAEGCFAVAPDQRGYSPGARPADPAAYGMAHLTADAFALADAIGAERFDVVGHDWGAAVAWHLGTRHTERVRSLTAVSVPHPLALTAAMQTDPDQQRRSGYIGVYRREGGVAERALTRDDHATLRAMYGDAVAPEDVEHYVERLSAPGALTAALNWYRAASRADLHELGPTTVPTLYVWSTEDLALGRTAAEATAGHVTGPYRFVELEGVTHWVADEVPDRLADLVVEHLRGT